MNGIVSQHSFQGDAHVAGARESPRDAWLRAVFESGDTNSDKELTFAEVVELMKHLNFHMPRSQLKRRFYEADMNAKGDAGFHKLDFAEFCTFYKRLATRRDIGEILVRYGATLPAGGNPGELYDHVFLTAEQLARFLRVEQSTVVTPAAAAALINDYEPTTELRQHGLLGIEGFSRLMLGPLGDIEVPELHSKVYHDMTQPLSHYFIASSHNTFVLW